MKYPVLSPLLHDGESYPIDSEIGEDVLTPAQVAELLANKTIGLPVEPAAEEAGTPAGAAGTDATVFPTTPATTAELAVAALPAATTPAADQSVETEMAEMGFVLLRACRLLAEAVTWTPGEVVWREEVSDLFEGLGFQFAFGSPDKLFEDAVGAVPGDGAPASALPDADQSQGQATKEDPAGAAEGDGKVDAAAATAPDAGQDHFPMGAFGQPFVAGDSVGQVDKTPDADTPTAVAAQGAEPATAKEAAPKVPQAKPAVSPKGGKASKPKARKTGR